VVLLVGHQVHPRHLQVLEGEGRDGAHGLGHQPVAGAAAAAPVAHLDLGHRPVRPVQARHAHEAAGGPLQQQEGEVLARGRVGVAIAAEQLRGLHRRLLGHPGNGAQETAQIGDGLGHRLVHHRPVARARQAQLQTLGLERVGEVQQQGKADRVHRPNVAEPPLG
jgi:hypothetical protein